MLKEFTVLRVNGDEGAIHELFDKYSTINYNIVRQLNYIEVRV